MEQYSVHINRNIITLSIGSVMVEQDESRLTFDLMARDPDDNDEILLNDFKNIFYDLVIKFSENHVVLYGSPYKKTKYESKRWFSGKWKPGKYSTIGSTTKLKQQLIRTNWCDGLYADITDFYEKKILWAISRLYSKNLYILQEKLDMQLFKKTDMSYADEASYGTFISIFKESNIFSFEDSSATIVHYLKNKKTIMELSADIVLPRIGLSADKEYIQQEKCIEIIKQIAEKHNKILEVNI